MEGPGCESEGGKQQIRETRTVEQHRRRGGLGGLFNGRSPLIPYAMRGAVWYQGEANSHPERELYQHQLPPLVGDWRKLWGEDFPFAGFNCQTSNGGRRLMLVREAMLKALLPLRAWPSRWTSAILDIHPKNKQEVGRRFALGAGNRLRQEVPSIAAPACGTRGARV